MYIFRPLSTLSQSVEGMLPSPPEDGSIAQRKAYLLLGSPRDRQAIPTPEVQELEGQPWGTDGIEKAEAAKLRAPADADADTDTERTMDGRFRRLIPRCCGP